MYCNEQKGHAHEKDKHTFVSRKERLAISEKAKIFAEADSLCSGTTEQRNPFFSAENLWTPRSFRKDEKISRCEMHTQAGNCCVAPENASDRGAAPPMQLFRPFFRGWHS
jgi:hypothetical protein